MARNFKPHTPYNVAMRLLVPTSVMVKGVRKDVFSEPEDSWLFYASFRTFGGTESFSNNVYTVISTATVETWFDPRIQSDCRIYIEETGETYEIINQPENIDMRNQWLQFRIQKIGGKP